MYGEVRPLVMGVFFMFDGEWLRASDRAFDYGLAAFEGWRR